MVREDLVEWIYRLASGKRENDPVCAQICTEIENGEEEPGKLATGYCIDRVLVDEQKAWSRFYTLTRYQCNPSLAVSELRQGAPWLVECEYDSVEEQARRCLAVRKYIVSNASISPGAVTGPCFGTEAFVRRPSHPAYHEYKKQKYKRESNGE